MTLDSWQRQWEKSILTVCEIHGAANKGCGCSPCKGSLCRGGDLGPLGVPSGLAVHRDFL